ncbi:hypothetical protein KF707_10865 [Candidatus Obscuribacterales bacterium]|nr:hypothetical protein [Candidatus Obscuribacterales bacterium]MBX3136727.1 hypothetical protein [Candidatus Obscuribacterales bacterium]MBX3148563.1 hypothetical protein [Candidatus Obscuribacterales bacterium]
MLDVRKPLGLLFIILGALLFLYGMYFSPEVNFQTPNAFFPLKLNMPVGAFMFIFGVIMWQLARYVELKTLDHELTEREKELDRVEKKRAKALAKQQAAAAASGVPGSVDLSDTNAARQSKVQESEAVPEVDVENDEDVESSGDTASTASRDNDHAQAADDETKDK